MPVHTHALMGLSAAVLGASGYGGAEVLRYLQGHPVIDVAMVAGATTAGRQLDDVVPGLTGALDTALVPVDEAASAPVDVLFSCLPSGELAGRLDEVAASVVVDLADDHRADPSWTYGL